MVAPGKYVKRPAHDRKSWGPRFRGEDGMWFGTKWMPTLYFLAEDDRVMPPTRPDEESWYHEYGCRCEVCCRPSALWWKRRKATHATVPRAGPRSSRP